ncbi:ferritin, partial [Candidatus Endoriftia persephone str. Guaymas]|nr:ferritin [Candidatus Endoriftia persephone str. Guaymas]
DSTHPDLTQTYENLIRGSRNHLRAFVRQIESLGVPYTAQALDQLQVEIILEQPMEQGRTTRGRR